MILRIPKICGTCKHWRPPKGAYIGTVWGDCKKLHDNDLIEIYSTHGFIEWHGEGNVGFDIHPTFGCRLWEWRKKCPQ